MDSQIPFDAQSMASNIDPSVNSKKKLTIKLTNPSNNATKRVRDIPENFSALKKVVKAQMSKKGTFMEKLINSEKYSISYTDDCGDVINVSDDEDLYTAFEVAETSLGNQLKLNILPRNDDESALKQSMSSLLNVEEKPAQVQATVEVQKKMEKMQIVEESTLVDEKPEKQIVEEQKEPEITEDIIREAIKESLAGGNSSDSSDSEELCDDQKKVQNENCSKLRSLKKQWKQEKRDKKKMIKHQMKEKHGGLPRKAFKKLIKKELEKQKTQTLNELMNCPDIQIDSEQSDINDHAKASNEKHIHKNVACDGCGVSPIVGIRYKCSVLKNFDFCANCEARRDHDHPFLKIVRPEQCPKAIFTIIDDRVPNVKADLEQNCNSTFFRNMGPQGEHIGKNMRQFFKQMFGGHGQGRHGHCHGGPGRHGGPGQWGKRPHHMRQGQGNCPWKIKRAELVLVEPSDVMTLNQDKTAFVNVTVNNNTDWPWKQGCYLANSPFQNGVADILETVNIPIDYVGAHANYVCKIPLTVKQSAPLTGNGVHHEATFQFHGPKGGVYGEPITVKFRIVKQVSQIEVYQTAINMMESHADLGFKFEDITKALIENSNDDKAALEILKSKKQDEEMNGENLYN